MRSVRQAIGQAILLLLVGTAIGFGANELRGRNRIDPGRNYFPPLPSEPEGGHAGGGANGVSDGGLKSPYAVISLEELLALLADPAAAGTFVLLDARNEHAYGEGHLPGAVRCDPYGIDYCIDAVTEPIVAAYRVIVYCGGGDCEDSHLMCHELEARGLVQRDQLCVFAGGWEVWQHQVEAGSPEAARHEAEPASPAPQASVFQEASLADVLGLFENDQAAGAHVFVDARADEAYEAGHIPGAVQCDYYRLESYLPEVLTRVGAAEKIIVYCNGGDCEDSLQVCGELLRADVPKARILVFRGGWEAWDAAELPVETGRP
jgi:3-mercaptopyruvate sulfurtransferase SseA